MRRVEAAPIRRGDWLFEHPVVVFYIVTFGLEFGILVALLALGISLSASFGRIAVMVALYAPTIAALFLTAFESGWTGVRAILGPFGIWRVGFRWYLVALFSVAAVGLVTRGVYMLAGGTAPAIQWPTLSVLALMAVQGPLAEEAGWRGYVLPRLQSRMNALSASLIIGVLWGAVWHLPMFLTGSYTVSYAWFVLLTTVWAILFTWVYNHTNGSLFIAWLMHFAINVSFGALGLAEGALFPLFVLLNVGLAVVIVAVFGPHRLARDHRWRSPASLRGAWHGFHHG